MRNTMLILCGLCCLLTPGIAQVSDSTTIRVPQTWLGSWEGHMNIFHLPDSSNSVAVHLEIRQTESPSRWTWKLTYGEGEEAQERAYELEGMNTLRGFYRIDEKNSIYLPATFRDQSLFSFFLVGDNLIQTTYRLQADGHLVFENVVSKYSQVQKSGGEGDIPEVSAYPVRGLQRSVLQKK